jgi:hypothetical protein
VVDRGFEPNWIKAIYYEIDICCFSAVHTWWPRHLYNRPISGSVMWMWLYQQSIPTPQTQG